MTMQQYYQKDEPYPFMSDLDQDVKNKFFESFLFELVVYNRLI